MKSIWEQPKKQTSNENGFSKFKQRFSGSNNTFIEPVAEDFDKGKGQANILNNLQLEQAIQLAKKKTKEGSLEDAKLIYTNILSRFPKNKRVKQAMKALLKRPVGQGLVVQDPPKDQLKLLISLYSEGQLDSALAIATQLLLLFSKSLLLNNICGGIYLDLHRYAAAVDCFNRSVILNPKDANTYYNLGVALVSRGEGDAAIENFRKAITIKPDYALAYYDLGNALSKRGNLDAAIDIYKKLLKIKPDYAEVYYNMGNALWEKDEGDLSVVLESYKNALRIKPDHYGSWSNISPLLSMFKSQGYSEAELFSFLPENLGSQQVQIRKLVLQYELNKGNLRSEGYLVEGRNLLSKAENRYIQNPKMTKNSSGLKLNLPKRLVALVHFGRSGTGLMHSLIDGHPEVSTLPSIYLSQYFDGFTWDIIISGGWGEMVDRFIANYEVLFDASSEKPVQSLGHLIKNMGKKEGLTQVGPKGNEVLKVSKTIFRTELSQLMKGYDRLDAFVFFELVQTSYNKAINDINNKNLLFYHIHNPSTYAQINFGTLTPNAEFIMMVREPIQSCESWLRKSFFKNNYKDCCDCILKMLFEIDNITYHKQTSIGLRLEDLKEQPRKTIPALCKWMGIGESESLYEMTAQGKKWWGDPASPDFKKEGMDPFGKTAISRRIGLVFSDNDQFILRTLFYPFSVRFGYENENAKQFELDLQRIRPMLDEVFDFEKAIVERKKVGLEDFRKSLTFLYFRSQLLERWNVLNEHHTYPNMIPALLIK